MMMNIFRKRALFLIFTFNSMTLMIKIEAILFKIIIAEGYK